MRVSVKDKGEKNEENLWDAVWTDRPTTKRESQIRRGAQQQHEERTKQTPSRCEQRKVNET